MYTEQELEANKKLKEDRKVKANLEDQAIDVLTQMQRIEDQILHTRSTPAVLKALMKDSSELSVVYQNLNNIYHGRYKKTLQQAQEEALGNSKPKMIVT